MQPKSFSATALETAELCPARYGSENVLYGRGFANTAASLGSTVHDALENYVKHVHLEKTHDGSLDLLLDLFKMGWIKIQGNADFDNEDFRDGTEMLKSWHARTDFTTFEVLSCEIKENFPINTPLGPIPFNYIWDRHDRISETEIRIVDYKTNRWGINPDDLRKKVQARCYALAAMIKYKDDPRLEKIWVEFDMLRHDGPVGVVFSREDNVATWTWLKELAARITSWDEDNLEERLNPNCNFCVRKTSCTVVQRNLAVGGIMAITRAEDAVDLRARLEYQAKAIQNAMNELDIVILAQARTEDVESFESEYNTLNIGVSRRRAVDAERVEMVIGPNLFDKWGGKAITLKNVDALLKSTDLTPQQKADLKSMIYYKNGEPSVKVSPKNPITGD